MTQADRCAPSDPTPGVMKLMVDTNIADDLLVRLLLLADLRAAVSSGRLELLVTHLQIDEVMETPENKSERRDALVNVLASLPARRVATYGFVVGRTRLGFGMLASSEHSQLYDELISGNIRHQEDAILILTAAYFWADILSNNTKDMPRMAKRVGIRSFTTREFLDLLPRLR
ncbi:MAG: hypothetical protein K8R99_01520 [Actinomycetia bacterium]|nr:hypothetical protein [Actinomycetes bacterium]